MNVADLNAMPEPEAARTLAECCGASGWVSGMLARRPFASRSSLLSAADEIWRSLDPADWREGFTRHPRIGEPPQEKSERTRRESWAAGEQAGVASASTDLREALAGANREYERRFGYIYIVCATGKSAEEMLSLAQRRLSNDEDAEIAVAAEEQRKITRLRLEKLLDERG